MIKSLWTTQIAFFRFATPCGFFRGSGDEVQKVSVQEKITRNHLWEHRFSVPDPPVFPPTGDRFSTPTTKNRIYARTAQAARWWRLLCHRIKLLHISLCSKLNDKLNCKEIKFLTNILVYLLVTVDTSTTLSTQRWINRIVTFHSKMGILLVSVTVALSSNKALILVFKA